MDLELQRRAALAWALACVVLAACRAQSTPAKADAGAQGGAVAAVAGSRAAPHPDGGAASERAAGAGGTPEIISTAEVAGAAALADDAPHAHADHCVDGYAPQPSDDTMRDGPAEFYPPGNMDPSLVDTTVQPEVLAWLTDNLWQAAHVEWHAARACGIGGGRGASKVDICSHAELVPKDQNCQTAGDGYQFLVFHRHMIQALKQLWPKHAEQFTGFAKFPTSAQDVPPQWRSVWKSWEPEVMAAGKIGDEIDKPENLARFPDEGVLGFWLQCNVGQRLRSPANDLPFVGLHFVLHAKWARPGNTTHGVNNTEANIDNYMFWKLHGWIDNVWEKYRLAKGLPPTAAKLHADLTAQCREMDAEIALIKSVKKTDAPAPVSEPSLPRESGFFHEQVRPIFARQSNLCSGCHAETGANAMLVLGGDVSSAEIVRGLVDQPSLHGGQYALVVPGDPERSWLYLKASGESAAVSCTPSSTAQCITATMPPSASGLPTLTAAELAVLRQWIQDGARGPS